MRTAVFLFLFLFLSACGGSGGPARPAAVALSILPPSLPGGTSGAFYTVTLRAAGGTGSGHAWRLAAGLLPPGLSGLPATGPSAALGGTLGAAGTYSFTVE
ncbi:MAG: hypothetical protein ACE5JG_04120, partial [Planctomycetota bacterium]